MSKATNREQRLAELREQLTNPTGPVPDYDPGLDYDLGPVRERVKDRIPELLSTTEQLIEATRQSANDVPQLLRIIEAQQAALRAVAAVHNSEGRRMVGFPRADHEEAYCTHCQRPAPCPTLVALDEPEATL